MDQLRRRSDRADAGASQIRNGIRAKKLEIIAEPWYTPGSALKLRATWRPTPRVEGSGYRTTTWTVCSLSSPLARFARLYCPSMISVVLEAPTRGHRLMALLVLRAKVMDICGLLRLMYPDKQNLGQIWFLGPPADPMAVSVHFGSRGEEMQPRPAGKPFWESSRGIRPSLQRNLRRPRSTRPKYPFFYEYLLLPLCSSLLWKLGTVSFDREPSKKHTSFFHEPATAGGPVRYLGYQRLVDLKTQYNHLDMEQPATLADWMALKNVDSVRK